MKTIARSLFLAVSVLVLAFSSVSFAKLRIENGTISFMDQATKKLSELEFNFPPDTPPKILAMKGKVFKDDFSNNYVIPASYNSITKEVILFGFWEKGSSGKPLIVKLKGLYNPRGFSLPSPSITWKLSFLKDGKFSLINEYGRGVTAYFTPIVKFSIPEPASEKDKTLSRNEIISAFSGKTVIFEKWSTAKGTEPYLNGNGFVEFYVDSNGFTDIRGKTLTKKLTWTVDDDGKFCVGMDEQKGFWGCKTIMKLADGSFYGKGSSEHPGVYPSDELIQT
jgi:hypothetical protein